MPLVPTFNENGYRAVFIVRSEFGFLFLPPSGKIEWRKHFEEGTMFNSEIAANHHASRTGIEKYSLSIRDWPESDADKRVSKYWAN